MKKYLLLLTFVLAPLILHAQETKLTPLPPFFWYEVDPIAQRKFLMAFLLYWKGEDPSGKFNLIAPFFYQSQTSDEKLRIFLPFHYQYTSKEVQSSLWALYFEKKTLREKTRLFFPFHYSSKTPQAKLSYSFLYLHYQNPNFTSHIFFPFYWSFDFADVDKISYQALIPIYLKTHNKKEQTRLTLSYFFYQRETPIISESLFLNFYRYKSPANTTEVFFPFHWKFLRQSEKELKDIEITIPYFRVQTSRVNFRSFFPLYWARTETIPVQQSKTAGSQSPTDARTQLGVNDWRLFFPLYHHAKKPDGTERTITPFYSRFLEQDGKTFGHKGIFFYSQDVWGGKTTGFFPLFYYRHEPDFFKLRILPLYIRKNADKEKFHFSFFPFIRYRRLADRTQWLSPLFYLDKSSDHSHGLFALYYWKSETNEEEGKHRVPLLQHRIFFPLIWRFSSESEKSTVIPPLFAAHSNPDFSFSYAFPFYFQKKKQDDRLTGLFFLFWERKVGTQRSYAFLPLYRRAKFPDGYSILLPGFYFLKEKEKTQGFFPPYIWKHRGKTQYEILPPLYLQIQRPEWSIKTFIPVYSLETTAFKEEGIFPIWAKTKAVSPPTTADGDEKKTDTPAHFLANSHRFLPFYLYRKLENGSDIFFPFLLGRVLSITDPKKGRIQQGRILIAGSWEKTNTSFSSRFDPLYSYKRSPDQKGFSIPTAPFPLWQYEMEGLEEEKSKKGAFFPYYWLRTSVIQRDLIFPLFFKKEEKNPETKKITSQTLWVIPFFVHKKPELGQEIATMFPIYWEFVSKESSKKIFPPLYLEQGASFKREIFFPLWWHRERDEEKVSVFFPLYLKSEDVSAKRKVVLAPGFWQSRDAESSAMIALNYFSRENFDKNEKVQVGFPLFWKWKEKDRHASYLFPFYFHHKRENLDWKIAFPLFWKFKTAETETMVIPPYFSIFSHTTQKKTTGFAPFWDYSKSLVTDWEKFQILGGLFGVEKEGTKKKWFFLYNLFGG